MKLDELTYGENMGREERRGEKQIEEERTEQEKGNLKDFQCANIQRSMRRPARTVEKNGTEK